MVETYYNPPGDQRPIFLHGLHTKCRWRAFLRRIPHFQGCGSHGGSLLLPIHFGEDGGYCGCGEYDSYFIGLYWSVCSLISFMHYSLYDMQITKCFIHSLPSPSPRNINLPYRRRLENTTYPTPPAPPHPPPSSASVTPSPPKPSRYATSEYTHPTNPAPTPTTSPSYS